MAKSTLWKLNENEIIFRAKKKAALEMRVMLKLEEKFGEKGAFLDTLRDFVAQGIEDMALLPKRDPLKVSVHPEIKYKEDQFRYFNIVAKTGLKFMRAVSSLPLRPVKGQVGT